MKKLFTAVAILMLALFIAWGFGTQNTYAIPSETIETSDVVFVEETDELNLTLDHAGKFIVNNSEEPTLSVYIPEDAEVAFPIGTEIRFGYGLVGLGIEFVCHEEVYLIHNILTQTKVLLGGVVTLKKIGTNTWTLYGDLVPYGG